MNIAFAHLFRNASGTDEALKVLCGAYALQRGTVSRSQIVEEMEQVLLPPFNCNMGRLSCLIHQTRLFVKTGIKVKGSVQYRLVDDIEMSNPHYYKIFSDIARGMFQ